MQVVRAKDSRIHRDISLGNIILVKVPGRSTRQGYLIDWEASCRIDDVGEAMEVGRAVSDHACLLKSSTKYLSGHMAFYVHANAQL